MLDIACIASQPAPQLNLLEQLEPIDAQTFFWLLTRGEQVRSINRDTFLPVTAMATALFYKYLSQPVMG